MEIHRAAPRPLDIQCYQSVHKAGVAIHYQRGRRMGMETHQTDSIPLGIGHPQRVYKQTSQSTLSVRGHTGKLTAAPRGCREQPGAGVPASILITDETGHPPPGCGVSYDLRLALASIEARSVNGLGRGTGIGCADG